MTSITDAEAMARALELAERGWGRVHPNPMVGAVVVRDGAIVGEGWHAEYGGPHAEPVALAAAGAAARGATLVVTLEPCAHHGKTPPCVDAVLAAGIARVVIAMRDPNPVAAGGIARLEAAGVEVVVGEQEDAGRRLNARFVHAVTQAGRPFVAVKLAVTMDGCIADHAGRSQWISGPEARAWVHWVRAGFDAIAVGAETAIVDGARLTVRGEIVPRVTPRRVVFDRGGHLEVSAPIFADLPEAPLTIVTARAPEARQASWRMAGAAVCQADSLEAGLGALGTAGVEAVLVEGGGRLAGALLGAELVDRVYQVVSPRWLGDGRRAWAGLGALGIGDAPAWRTVERQALGNDTLLVLER